MSPAEFEPTGAAGIDDAARDQMVERLREHVGTGRLTLAEFEKRVTSAFAARTAAELEWVTSGLPAPGTAESQRPAPRRWIVGVFGVSTTRGRWRLSSRLRSVAAFGGTSIDVRATELDSEQITITAVAVFGGVDIYLPDSVDLELTGGALFDGNDVHGGAGPARPGAPVVRVRALSVFGGTDVYRCPAEAGDLPPREARKLARRTR